MGADYSFELIYIETYAPQFIGHDKFFLGSVIGQKPFNTFVPPRRLREIVLSF